MCCRLLLLQAPSPAGVLVLLLQPTAADWLVLPLTMCCRLLLLQAPSPAGVLVLLLQL